MRSQSRLAATKQRSGVREPDICQMSSLPATSGLIMLAKILCVWMLWHAAAAQELVAALRGGGVALCLGGAGRQCAGALWRRHWVVARASCLSRSRTPLHLVRAALAPATCRDFDEGRRLAQAGKVLASFVHPPPADLSLLVLDRSARAPNASAAHRLLLQFEPWMEEMYLKYSTSPSPPTISYKHTPPLISYEDTPPSISYEHTHCLFSTPLRMFCTTVLLPSLSFMVFFVFVVFYTGPKDEIPYKSIQEEKTEDSQLGV